MYSSIQTLGNNRKPDVYVLPSTVGSITRMMSRREAQSNRIPSWQVPF